MNDHPVDTFNWSRIAEDLVLENWSGKVHLHHVTLDEFNRLCRSMYTETAYDLAITQHGEPVVYFPTQHIEKHPELNQNLGWVYPDRYSTVRIQKNRYFIDLVFMEGNIELDAQDEDRHEFEKYLPIQHITIHYLIENPLE